MPQGYYCSSPGPHCSCSIISQYDFKKRRDSERIEFEHAFFLRGRPDILHGVERKPARPRKTPAAVPVENRQLAGTLTDDSSIPWDDFLTGESALMHEEHKNKASAQFRLQDATSVVGRFAEDARKLRQRLHAATEQARLAEATAQAHAMQCCEFSRANVALAHELTELRRALEVERAQNQELMQKCTQRAAAMAPPQEHQGGTQGSKRKAPEENKAEQQATLIATSLKSSVEKSTSEPLTFAFDGNVEV